MRLRLLHQAGPRAPTMQSLLRADLCHIENYRDNRAPARLQDGPQSLLPKQPALPAGMENSTWDLHALLSDKFAQLRPFAPCSREGTPSDKAASAAIRAVTAPPGLLRRNQHAANQEQDQAPVAHPRTLSRRAETETTHRVGQVFACLPEMQRLLFRAAICEVPSLSDCAH